MDNLEIVEMLAATLAHEVKNPLALLRANIDYIELCDIEKKYTKSYNVMKTQLEKTDSILNNFVWLLQCSQEKNTQVNIPDVITEAVKNYSDTYELGVELDITEENIYVNGSERLLPIVFSNIIKNSIEAGAENIKISAHRSNGTVKIDVIDDGHGLTEDTLKRLEEYYSYTTKKYGNGIGVLICRRAILECGGSYHIGNAPDGGCQVSIELPEFTPSPDA